MAPELEKRVEILEHKVEGLEQLPQRVSALEVQIVQLHAEMREGFSALLGENADIRGEITGFKAHVTQEIAAVRSEADDFRDKVTQEFAAVRSEAAAFRAEVQQEFAAVRSEAAAFRAEVKQEFANVRAEINAGDEETRRYMRVLHEEVIDRIKRIGEARAD